MTTVVVLACILIIVFLITIVLGFYRSKVKEQKNIIEALQQENEELKEKYDKTLNLLQHFQRQKAIRANDAIRNIQTVRDGPDIQN